MESNINISINPYPIGSVYFSINNINPSNYFGGEWELLGDKLIVSGNLNVVGNGKALTLTDGSSLYSLGNFYTGNGPRASVWKPGELNLNGTISGASGATEGKAIGVATKDLIGDNLDNSGLIALNNGSSIYSWKRIA